MTLCEATQIDANGAPVHVGAWVKLHGTAIVPSNLWQGTGNNVEFQITDGQCCVDIFKSGTTTPFVQAGDYVEVIGTIANYNGLIQVGNPNCTITVLGSGYPLPTPALITTGQLATNGNNYENCLVKIRCLSIISGTWPATGQNANITVDDGTGPVTLRIDKDTNIDGSPAPTGAFTVTGLAIQFDSTLPYTEGFQILPRSLDDLLLNDCLPPVGACCFLDGHCTVMLPADCQGEGGAYQGDGTNCDPNPCIPGVGACCFPDGRCAVLTQADCAGQNGTFMGFATSCEPNPCTQPPVACCFNDGHCEFLVAQDCFGIGGTPLPYGSVCDPNPCVQPPVACCYPDGHCEFLIALDCTNLGGIPQAYGSVCDPNPCPQPVAACCFESGDCAMLTELDCATQGGIWQGMGVACLPENPCPQPPDTGACCLDDQGHCQVLTEQQCIDQNGAYQGDNTTCDPNPCPIVPTRGTTWGRIKGTYR